MTTVAPTLIESTLQPNLTLVLVTVFLVATGTALALDRSLVRVLLGMVLIGNGVAVLYLVVSGRAGRPPFVGEAPESISDPLPQALPRPPRLATPPAAPSRTRTSPPINVLT